MKKIPGSALDCSNGQLSGTSDFQTNPFLASIGVFLSLAAETPAVMNPSVKHNDRSRVIGFPFLCERRAAPRERRANRFAESALSANTVELFVRNSISVLDKRVKQLTN